MSGRAEASRRGPSPARDLGSRALGKVRRAALAPYFGALTSVRTSAKAVALTFDDGPHPEHTPALLDLLARHGALATHFFVGEAARRHPELVAAALEAGHAVGSHTSSHRSLVRLSASDLADEVAEGHAALGAGVAPLFRPPYGHYDLATASAVRRAGLRCVMWSATAGDWRRSSPQELAHRLRRALRPGAIVLLHEALYTSAPDDEPDRGPIFAALDEVLSEQAGLYRFVTVPQLLRLGRPVRTLVERRGDDEFVASQLRLP